MFKENIEILKKYDFKLARELEDFELSDKYNIYINKNQEEIIELKNSKNRLISKYNANRDAVKSISDMDFNVNSAIFVVTGMEWGYKLKKIYEKFFEKMYIIIIERDLEVLKMNFMKKDYTEILKTGKVYFACGDYEDQNYISKLKAIIYGIVHSTSKILVTKPTSNFKEDIIFFTKSIKFMNDTARLFSFKLGNSPDDTLLGLKNRFENAVSFVDKPGLNDLLNNYNDVYKNKPAVVVASGPSLEKNIKYLKEYQDKILILSCDGSYKRLKMEGIKAHAIGSIERIKATYKAFYEGEESNFDKDLVMLSPAVVRKDVIDIFKDRFLSFYKPDMHGTWFGNMTNKGDFFNGASVAHLLFGFAQKMKCNPIILIGQDLAYSKDGVSHAKGVSVIEYKDKKDYEIYLKDINGEDVGSTHIWKMFKEIYEEALTFTDCKVIDATEGGAYIEGTEVAKFKETLETYCDEKITPLYKLYRDLNYKNKNSKKMKELLIEKTFSKYKLLLELSEDIKISLKKLEKSFNIIERGIKTQKELDSIYDIIFHVDGVIVNKIIEDDFIYLITIYPISNVAKGISALNTNKFDEKSLKANVELQKHLLKELKLYIGKTLKIVYLGIEYMLNEVDIEVCDIDLVSMKTRISYLFENDKYTLKVE
ncbi:MAG: DUF115 domain-containing protein [Peptostreptococcaceae bacterium]|nr:DUF115 domain-containing protein [Peptostreptococcaceae bacterium]